MRRIRAFGHFWWDFVVGDDWRTAASVVLAIGATAVLVADPDRCRGRTTAVATASR